MSRSRDLCWQRLQARTDAQGAGDVYRLGHRRPVHLDRSGLCRRRHCKLPGPVEAHEADLPAHHLVVTR
eukprot:14593260-Heterocapsa_arctica.AAC.1